MINSSWDIGSGGLKLVILDHFLSLYSLKNQKNQNFEKMKKNLGDIIIFLMSTKNHKYMMYSSWDTEGDKQIFFSFWAIFSLFTPLIKNLKKCLEIFFLHMYTINEDYMMYDSWNIRHDRQNFLSFCPIFCPFTAPWRPGKSKFWKIEEILHMCTINDNHMVYGTWNMERDGQNFFSFWVIFCSFTPLTMTKITFLKKWKKHLEILSFCKCVPQITIIWCMVPEIWRATDGILQTDVCMTVCKHHMIIQTWGILLEVSLLIKIKRLSILVCLILRLT